MPSSNSDRSFTDRLDATIPGAFPSSDGNQSSTHQTLSQALYARRNEYTRSRNVRIKIGSWNVAAEKGTEKDIGAWFVEGKGIEKAIAGLGVDESQDDDNLESVPAQEARRSRKASTVPRRDDGTLPGGEEVGIYVLGLQEVVDVSSPSEALRPYTDPSVANRWKSEVQNALPEGYKLVAEQQLIGLLLLVYASPDVFPHVSGVSTTSVGTGLMGYMGNKGAVTARIVLGETTRLVFINSHLAAGSDKAALDRRNWDAGQVISRTRFDPITDALGVTQGHGEGLGEEDFAFWFGDLNYRLEGIPGDDVRRLLTIHTKTLDPEPTEDSKEPRLSSSDSSVTSKSPSSTSSIKEDAVPLPPELDPASLHTTISCLMPHDELRQQQKLGKAFQDGWNEGPIQFLPTYKYDVGKVGVFDSSEKRRVPSWCDRILYRTRAAKERHDAHVKEQEEARKRDEEMKKKGLDAPGDEEVLYDYDPETDGDKTTGYDDYDEYDEDAEPEPEEVITKEGFKDEILLEYYAAHLRVISSDHKPLDAIFSLKYDAVIPELKASIHQEVARELDRQENEGRPSITLVVDRSTGATTSEAAPTTDNDFDGVDFNDVQFAKSKRRNITIANTGRVPATFGFTDRPVSKDQAPGPFPSWLTVTFDREPDKTDKSSDDNLHQQFTLEPADVCSAELKLKVEAIHDVRNLNEGSEQLDEILVLRVQNGRDHFLPIRADWQQSALARSIDKLIKIPEGGIRKLQGQKPDSETNKVRWSIPREIFRLTEAIEDLTERTIAEWDMTKHEGDRAPWQHNAGWPFVKDSRYFEDDVHEDTLAALYEALDCDTSFDAAFPGEVAAMQRLEIISEVLLQFLRSLEDGVVTESLWKDLEGGIVARERSRQHLPLDDAKIWALETLSVSPSHNATFLLLISMLQRLTNEIVTASRPDTSSSRASMDSLPSSPRVAVRRRTLSKVPEVATRQLISRNYATVFSEAMFRSGGMDQLKEKERNLRKDRMVGVIETFLSEDDALR
ncbi:DNase I-like protein [Aaosphaeria arxii CBS 175.79]|uniref:DNase I-like protein n=1 Tax=Aaosphaeria arxii CBS 175.79 TaxID=1450172 RepID=A0A6A5X7L6_9PLEO|nr:DNase I-like protein [Aaosphaeria arxii CBS 175.79]KAF2008807.1 DNase I-like protein [Aaosphaeria arxii CBS 175.79]